MGHQGDPRAQDTFDSVLDDVGTHIDALKTVSDAVILLQQQVVALGSALTAVSSQALDVPRISDALGISPEAEGAFAYIAYDIQDFLRLMVELDDLLTNDSDYAHADLRYRPVSFCEIGCGPGRNLHIVRTSDVLMWREAVGFDIIAPYIDAARDAFQLGDAVQVADAMRYDYSPHDVVFVYRPFSDDKMLADFETYLLDGLAVGSYLVAPLSDTFNGNPKLLAVGTSGQIWKKL